jgi:hypothetical protein
MSPLLVLPLGLVLGLLCGALAGRLFFLSIFHPQRELRFLGLRLPLTPALFLRYRGRLAEGVGDLFAKELLSGDILAERLSDPTLKSDLVAGIRGRLAASLEAPAASLFDNLGAGKDSLPGELARRAWAGLVESMEFSEAMARALGKALLLVEDLPLSLLVPPSLARSAAESVLSTANLERFETMVRRWIEERMGSRGTRNLIVRGDAPASPPPDQGFVAGLIPADSLEPLIGLLIEGLYTASIPVVENFLNDIDTRNLLERSANEIVRRAISRLSVVQRLIVGAANYERNLAETMPETVEDLVSMVSDILRSAPMRERTREAAIASWRDGIGAAGGQLASALGAIISRQSAYEALASVISILRGQGPRLAERAASLVAASPDATLGSLFALLGISGRDLSGSEGSARSAFDLRSLLSGESQAGKALAASIQGFVATLLESLGPLPLATLLRVDEAWKDDLATWLAERSLELVAAESPLIIDGLDLRSAIIEKIGAMNMLEAERGFITGGFARGLTLALAAMGGFIGVLNGLLMLALGGG